MRTVLTLALLTVVLPVSAQADEITQLKPMMLGTPLVSDGEPAAVIVASERYASLAEDLAKELEVLIGVRLPVQNDELAHQQFGNADHVIALGQFGNNRLLEKLYNRAYLVVDGAHPGADGYLLQTIHNPDGLGANVVVVGGSDDEGVRAAADRLIEVVRNQGSTLPRLLDVELGWGKKSVLARCEEVLAPDRVWPDTHPMEVQQAIAEAARLYLYTGDERLAQVYKRELLRFLNNTSLNGISDDFDYTMVFWDQMEESPVFTDEERLRITQGLWGISQLIRQDSELNYLNWKRVLNTNAPRHNHRARYAGSLYFTGRYFANYYNKAQCREWLKEVSRYWSPQMKATGVSEGSHPLGVVTLNKALEYALAEEVDSFLSPEVLGVLADRELARTIGNRWLPDPDDYQPFLFWTVAARRFNDPRYIRPLARLEEPMSYLRMPWRHTWTISGSHWDGTMPDLQESNVASWINPIAVDRAYYRNTEAYGAKNVQHPETFAMLTIQDPKLKGDQFLSLLGMSLGYLGTDGANAIEFFYLNNRRWLTGGGSPGGRIATAPKHSTLVVVRDGEIKVTPTYAKLLDVHSTPSWGISRTQLINHNGIDWTRNILNVPGYFFLVIDDAVAIKGGEYTLESRWVGHEHAALDGEDVVFPTRDSTLRSFGLGWENQYLRPWLFSDYLNADAQVLPKPEPFTPEGSPQYSVQLARRWSGRLENGELHRFVNLFSVEATGSKRPGYTLIEQERDRYLVTNDQDQVWLIRRDDETGWAVESAYDFLPTVSDSDGAETSSSLPFLEPDWVQQLGARILSAATVHVSDGESRWAVGLADGRVVVLDEHGDIASRHELEGTVYALTAIDLDGDGNDEVIGGTDEGHVVAIKADGTPYAAWRAPSWTPGPNYRQMFGTWRNVVTELHPFTHDGRPMLLAAGTFYYVLDADLRPVSSYEIQRELEVTDLPGNGTKRGLWRTGERTFVMTPVDFDGDGKPEIAGEEPDGYWLRVWDAESGERLNVYSRPADRYHGTSIKSIAAGDLDGDGKQEAIVGLDAFNRQLLVYDHPYQSQPRWTRPVSGAVEAVITANLLPGPGEQILIATELGHLQAFNGRGKRLFSTDTVEPVGATTALAVGRTGDSPLIGLVTVNGRIGVYDAQGQPLAQGDIDGYGTHVLMSEDGSRMLVVSADGAVQGYRLDEAAPR